MEPQMWRQASWLPGMLVSSAHVCSTLIVTGPAWQLSALHGRPGQVLHSTTLTSHGSPRLSHPQFWLFKRHFPKLYLTHCENLRLKLKLKPRRLPNTSAALAAPSLCFIFNFFFSGQHRCMLSLKISSKQGQTKEAMTTIRDMILNSLSEVFILMHSLSGPQYMSNLALQYRNS